VPHRFHFGPYQLFVRERRLTGADAQPVAIGDRALDVLMALVREQGALVSKRDLFEAAWAGLVVEDGNLHVQISALRKLLGPAAIATVPGRGYRLTLEVRAHDGPRPEPAAPSARTPQAIDGLSAPPRRSSPVIGREADVRQLLTLLQQHRVVSIVGPGGIGKTSLAQAVADAGSADGGLPVAWIDLGALDDASLIPSALAHGLGVVMTARVDITRHLAVALADQPLLIVLDCAEHLPQGVAQAISDLCRQTSGLRFLVTSQVRLKLDNEAVYAVQPLALPDGGVATDALSFGAVALFVARAQQASFRFALNASSTRTVVEICRRLHGNPLAIELAAARVPALGLDKVEAMLDDRFRLLTGGSTAAPARLQTLAQAFAWSHSLLPTDAQQVFQRLAVFQTSFSMDEAVQVASCSRIGALQVIDLLADLVDRSLVAVDGFEQPTYHLLESARVFAAAQLAAAADLSAHTHHLALCLALVQRATAGFESSDWSTHVRQLEDRLPDLLSGLRWSLVQGHDAETGAALAAGLTAYFIEHQLRDMALHWLELALQQRHRLSPLTCGRALLAMSSLQWHIGHPAQAVVWLDDCIAHLLQAGEVGFEYALALNERATALLAANRMAESLELANEALAIFQRTGQPKRMAEAQWNIGLATLFQGRHAEAAGHLLQARALAVQVTGSELLRGHSISHLLGECAYFSGDFAGAVREATQAIQVSNPQLAGDLVGRYHAYLALYEAARGQRAQAAQALAEAQRILAGCPPTMWSNNAVDIFASLAFAVGEDTLGLRWLAHADQARVGLRLPRRPVWQARFDHAVAAARTRRGEALLQAEQAAGRAMDHAAVMAQVGLLRARL
jgi:predicted ATPase/DNA-binding winged helix-turn-helix (wHTH) protein